MLRDSRAALIDRNQAHAISVASPSDPGYATMALPRSAVPERPSTDPADILSPIIKALKPTEAAQYRGVFGKTRWSERRELRELLRASATASKPGGRLDADENDERSTRRLKLDLINQPLHKAAVRMQAAADAARKALAAAAAKPEVVKPEPEPAITEPEVVATEPTTVAEAATADERAVKVAAPAEPEVEAHIGAEDAAVQADAEVATCPPTPAAVPEASVEEASEAADAGVKSDSASVIAPDTLYLEEGHSRDPADILSPIIKALKPTEAAQYRGVFGKTRWSERRELRELLRASATASKPGSRLDADENDERSTRRLKLDLINQPLHKAAVRMQAAADAARKAAATAAPKPEPAASEGVRAESDDGAVVVEVVLLGRRSQAGGSYAAAVASCKGHSAHGLSRAIAVC